MRLFPRARNEKGQTATEYMLAISVIVVALGAAFYQIIGQGNGGPVSKAFNNARGVVEAPYP